MADKNYFAGCIPATHEQVLQAREHRAALQKQLAEKYRRPVITVKLNIPGEIKSYPLAGQAFNEALAAVTRQLGRNNIAVAHREESQTVAGFEGFFVASGKAELLKQLMMAIEEGHPMGRLFDLDVIDENGNTLAGESFSRAERPCLLCGRPVWVCARSRAHSAEELAFETAHRIDCYFTNMLAENIAQTALRALLYEVSVTPKPGLVDRCNNGAHTDMDFYTFIDSSAALVFCFKSIVEASIAHSGPPETLLQALRFSGQEAESAMLAVTGGVNAHKGAIFSLGILCAACGLLYRDGHKLTADTLAEACRKIAGGAARELKGADCPSTHGTDVFTSHAITGARGEAAAGFPCVFKQGYPYLQSLAQSGMGLNDAGAATLLKLMATVDDTNIVHRKGITALRCVQAEAAALLAEEPDIQRLMERAKQLDISYIAQNISPGGSADMLALCFFLLFLPEENSALPPGTLTGGNN